MDKIISKQEQQKGKRKILIRSIAGIILIAFVFWGFRKIIKPQIDKNKIITATVEAGDIQNTLTATGLIIPAYEIELNAPVNTEIKEVLLPSGKQVKKGDLIMELDDKYIKLQYEQLVDELELRKTNIDKLKLEYDKNLRDLDFENQIKALELDGLEAQLKDFQRLLKVGGATVEDVEKAELTLSIAKLQNQKLANELDFRKKSNKSDKRSLELELNIQEKKLKELKSKLDQTSVKAPQDGVITWINEDLGRKISEGELIARIANLYKFKIEASCSDRYADIIKTGMPVKVRINKKNLNGTIQSILPAVENNTVKFTVSIDEADNKLLRPNMRVEVFIITDSKEGVLKIKRGPAFKGGSHQPVYVVRDNKAVQQMITMGISSSDEIEISGDIRKGDRIIISDTEDFEHLTEFELKK